MAFAEILVVGAYKPGSAIYVGEQLLRDLRPYIPVTLTRSKLLSNLELCAKPIVLLCVVID